MIVKCDLDISLFAAVIKFLGIIFVTALNERHAMTAELTGFILDDPINMLIIMDAGFLE